MKKIIYAGSVSLFFVTQVFAQYREAQHPFAGTNLELSSCARVHAPDGDVFAVNFPVPSTAVGNLLLIELALPVPFGTGGTNYRNYQILAATPNCNSSMTQLNNGVGISLIEVDLQTASINPAQLAMVGASTEGMWFGMIDRIVSNTSFPTAMFYRFPASSVGPPSKPLIVQESMTDNYYICGQFDKYLYVLKINSSGTIIWSQCYTDPPFAPGAMIPSSIILDPYSPGDIVLVGKTTTAVGGKDGFFMKVNGGNGSINLLKTYYQQLGNRFDAFNSISVASAGATTPAGFIIGGASGISPAPNLAKPTVLKLDMNGNVLWSKTIFSSSDSQAKGMLSVTERQNSNLNRLEYYGLFQSSLGNIVAKLDENGDPINTMFPTENSEFPYYVGSPLVFKPVGLALEDGALTGPATGLHAYGSSQANGNTNFHFAYAYFNGITGCTAPINLQNSTPINITSNFAALTNGTALLACPQIVISNFSNGSSAWGNCQGNTTAGSNMRPGQDANSVGLTEEEIYKSAIDEMFEVFPNPSSKHITIKTPSLKQDQVIRIYDVTGKLVLSQEVQSTTENHLDISMLSPALYWIELDSESMGTIRKKLIVE